LGFNVSGKVTPETVKPLPVKVAALTVTAAFPVEDKVSVFVVVVFTLTLPNDRLDVLTPRVIVDAPNCNVKVFVVLLALAVRVTV
jgi:hypothetical protein